MKFTDPDLEDTTITCGECGNEDLELMFERSERGSNSQYAQNFRCLDQECGAVTGYQTDKPVQRD